MSKDAIHESPMPSGGRREGRGHSSSVGGGVAESRPFRASLPDADPPDLTEALEDLNSLEEAAQEEGCPVPPNAMQEVAATQLRRLYGFAPAQYMVGPGPEGDILAYARPKRRSSIAFAFYADGGAFCSVLAPRGRFQVSRPSAEEITDAELRQAADLLARD